MDLFAQLRLRTQRTLRIALIWVLLGLLRALIEHNVLLGRGMPASFAELVNEHLLRSLIAGLARLCRDFARRGRRRR